MADTDDRVFNPHGRRHFRRRYSVREVQVGAAILLGLTAIAAWVAYRGAHPDPELFGDDPRLIPTGDSTVTVADQRAPRAGPRKTSFGRFEAVGSADLAPEGWRLTSTSNFGKDNLFEKINGREGFYKSYGFRRLDYGALVSADDRTIDIEWFDLGTSANALGAFSAERAEGAVPETEEDGLRYVHRNMAALVRGASYIRFVGGDETPGTVEAMKALLQTFSTLEGEALPWSYTLFVGGLGYGPEAISVEAADAFSFAFAKHVHIALKDDVELFVTVRPDDAKAHAKAFRTGFASLGEIEKGLVKNRYLSTYATARAHPPFVYGVRGAPSAADAQSALTRLSDALNALPSEVRNRALAGPASVPPPAGDEAYQDEEPPAEGPAEDGEETY